jgi:tetratricopeptide (TPR) repeat protein
MNDSLLLLVYLSILVALLAGVGWFLFRQIFKSRRVEGTMARLQKKLNEEKGTAKEHYELGSILLDKQLYKPAIDQFQKALKAKDLEGSENIAIIYNGLGFTYAAQEQYDLAIKQYKEALEIQPGYSTAWNNLGFAYEKKQLTAQALEAYDESLKSDPKNATAKRRATSLRKRLVPSS